MEKCGEVWRSVLAPRSASRSFELQQNKIQTGTEIWPEFWGLRAVLNPSHKTGILFKGKLNHVYLDLWKFVRVRLAVKRTQPLRSK